MKTFGITSTCALALILSIAAPVWAQEQHEQEQKEKPAMHEEKQAKPEKSVKHDKTPATKTEKPTKQEQKQAVKQEKPSRQEDKSAKENEQKATQPQKNPQDRQGNAVIKNDMRPGGQVQSGKNGVQARGGRIPVDRYKAKFGERHTFHVSRNDYARNHRFKYGGYSFGFVGAWPSDWLYTQDVYVIEIDGVYYLCNPMYPGVNIEINVIE